MRYLLPILLLASLLSACTTQAPAPVTEGWQQPGNVQGAYTVQPGDTLYSVAWRFGTDYRQLAAINGIEPPYELRVGEPIYLSGKRVLPRQSHKPTPVPAKPVRVYKPTPARVRVAKAHARESARRQGLGRVRRWHWPAQGRLIKGYGRSNKGINIAGRRGETVYATAPGEVVYAGHGIRGYGNLIIVKHNDEYLSAYAHNQKILVREGERVRARQPIAQMGSTGANKVFLHFEIRRAGRPVNPLPLLRRR